MTFLDRIVFPFRPNFAEPVIGQLDDFTYEALGAGAATPWKKTSGPKRKITYPFIFGTPAALAEFRTFIEARYGRLRGFWLPVWLNEFAIVADAAATDTQITIQRVRLNESLTSFAQFGYLAIATRTKLELYEIDSVAIDGDTEVITLTAGLATDLVARETICGGAIWARLTEDKLKIEFASDGVTRTQVAFTELAGEYETEHNGTAPLYLYEFAQGNEIWRFTNWGLSVAVVSGEETLTFAPQNLSHDSIRAGIDFLSEGLTIHAQTDDPDHPLRRHLQSNLLGLMDATLWESDWFTLAFTAAAPVYKGRIDKVDFDERGKIDPSVSSILRLNEREVPRKRFQKLDNNPLFGEFSGHTEAEYLVTGTLTAVTDTYVEADAFGAEAVTRDDPDWFALGRVTVGLEIRHIIGQDGNRLYINLPFRNAAIDDEASAVPGYDLNISTRKTKTDDLVNGFGFPWMPNQNPQFTDLMTPDNNGRKK